MNTEIDALKNALKRIVSERGASVLGNPSVTTGLLADYLPPEERQRLLRFIKTVYETQVITSMLKAQGRRASEIEINQWRRDLEQAYLKDSVISELISTVSSVMKIEITNARTSKAAKAVRSVQKISSQYFEDEVKIPFQAFAFRLLHDEKTLIIVGKQGEVAALCAKKGELLDQCQGIRKMSRAPGGERSYFENIFLFFELGDSYNTFYTMGVEADFSRWEFSNQKLRLISSVNLIQQNYDILRACILQASQKSLWTSWTCYSRDVPDGIPNGLLDAKLTPDRKHIVCLTNWFAAFRCDLKGVLTSTPFSIGDTFSIEPDNSDGSNLLLGSLRYSGAGGSKLLAKDGKKVRSVASISAYEGIHRIGNNAIICKHTAYLLPSYSAVKDSNLSIVHKIEQILDKGLILVVPHWGGLVHFFDCNSFQKNGDPLMGGHDSDEDSQIRDAIVTNCRKYLFTLAINSVCIWDFDTRKPFGKKDKKQQSINHGLEGSDVHKTRGGVAIMDSYGEWAIIEALSDSFQRPQGKQYDYRNSKLIGFTNPPSRDGLDYLILTKKKEALDRSRLPLMIRIFDKTSEINVDYLQHYSFRNGSHKLLHEMRIGDEMSYLGGVCPLNHNSTNGIDLGTGRIAFLSGGHIFVYDCENQRLLAEPKDLSGPGNMEAYKINPREWYYYEHLACSPDGDKICVTAYNLPMKIISSVNYSEINVNHDIVINTEDNVVWLDSRYVIANIKTEDEDREYLTTKNVEVMVDSMTGSLGEYLPVPAQRGKKCSIASGKGLIVGDGNLIKCYNLKDETQPIIIGKHHGLNDFMLIPDQDEIVSFSSRDGTARIWNLKSIIESIL